MPVSHMNHPRSLFQADPVQQHHKGGVQQHDKDHWLGPHRFGIIPFQSILGPQMTNNP